MFRFGSNPMDILIIITQKLEEEKSDHKKSNETEPTIKQTDNKLERKK